jgi:hypothetical protein
MSNIEKEYNKFIEMIRKVNPNYTPTNLEKQIWNNGYIQGTERALKKQLREDLTD